MTKDMEHCYICGSYPVAWHHIVNGTANRKKSDKYGLIVPLCPMHHDMMHTVQAEDIRLKKAAQRKFEMIYSHEKWMKEFHKNYLQEIQ